MCVFFFQKELSREREREREKFPFRPSSLLNSFQESQLTVES